MQRNPDTELRWYRAVTEAKDTDTRYQRYLTLFHFFRKEKKGKMYMSVTERRCVIFLVTAFYMLFGHLDPCLVKRRTYSSGLGVSGW